MTGCGWTRPIGCGCSDPVAASELPLAPDGHGVTSRSIDEHDVTPRAAGGLARGAPSGVSTHRDEGDTLWVMTGPAALGARPEITLDLQAAGTARVAYEDHAFAFAVQSDCSISRHLSRTGRFYELAFLQTLRQVVPAGSAVIDVGAHLGNHTVYFAAVMGCPVLALEANPTTGALLRHNVETNTGAGRVEIVHLAASDHEATGRLSRQYGGDAGTFSLEAGPPGTTAGGPTDAVDVATRPLDDVWRSSSIAARGTPVGLIKIDVEGHEPAVLRGATDLVAEHRPLITTEVDDLAHLQAVRQVLTPLGYLPLAAMNPTATVFWARPDGVCGELAHPHPVMQAGVLNTVRITHELNSLGRKLFHAPVIEGQGHLLLLGDGEPAAVTQAIAGLPDRVGVTRVALTRPGPDGCREAVPLRTAALAVARAQDLHGPPTVALIAGPVVDMDAGARSVVRALVSGLRVPYAVTDDLAARMADQMADQMADRPVGEPGRLEPGLDDALSLSEAMTLIAEGER